MVSVTAINEATACEEGLLEKIDWSKLLDPKDFEEVGGFGKCGLPNNFVSGGLTYDLAVIPDDKAPKTWADFWDVKKYPGKRGLLYRAEQTIEVALMADGVEPKDAMKVLAAPGGVERAFKKLAELKPHINWWKSGDELMQNILTGDVVMTFAWNGRVAGANRANNRKLKIAFEAGHVSGSQMIAVMKGTPRKDIAYRPGQARVVAGGAGGSSRARSTTRRPMPRATRCMTRRRARHAAERPHAPGLPAERPALSRLLAQQRRCAAAALHHLRGTVSPQHGSDAHDLPSKRRRQPSAALIAGHRARSRPRPSPSSIRAAHRPKRSARPCSSRSARRPASRSRSTPTTRNSPRSARRSKRRT